MKIHELARGDKFTVPALPDVPALTFDHMDGELVTYNEANALFSYEPETGVLRWKVRPSIGVKVGDIAGTKHPSGYRMVKVFGRQYPTHRIAWLLSFGAFPQFQIDHINRNRADNRLCNLREATYATNAQNRDKPNRTGYAGVTKARSGKWQARVMTDGKSRSIGVFDSPGDAHRAYAAAKRELHPFYYATTDDGNVANIAGFAECVRAEAMKEPAK
jgi:hypothetical protein